MVDGTTENLFKIYNKRLSRNTLYLQTCTPLVYEVHT